MKDSEIELIGQNTMNWLKEHIHFIKAGSDIEVATPLNWCIWGLSILLD